MGLYDSFIVGGEEYQSKAFGKLLREYYAGDEVKLWRSPFTEDEFNASLEGKFDVTVETPLHYQVECSQRHGLFLEVKENIFTGVEVRNESIPLYDNFGRLTDIP